MAIKIETDSGPPIFNESGVVDEPDPESEVTTEPEPEPTVVDESEPEITAEPESEPAVVDEPKPEPESEIEEFLVGILADLSAELAMKLVSFTPAVRVPVSLRFPDAYNPLQILLEATGSQEYEFLVVQNTIGPVFSREDLPRHVACVLFEVPSTVAGWSRKPVSPPPPWLSRDVSVLIFRPSP